MNPQARVPIPNCPQKGRTYSVRYGPPHRNVFSTSPLHFTSVLAAMFKLGQLLLTIATVALFHGENSPWTSISHEVLTRFSQLLSQHTNVCPSLICNNISALQYIYHPLDLSLLKALGRPEGSIPSSVCVPFLEFLSSIYYSFPFHHQIVLESFVALFLGIIGACLNAPPLKEITWASEMRTRYAATHLLISLFALGSS